MGIVMEYLLLAAIATCIWYILSLKIDADTNVPYERKNQFGSSFACQNVRSPQSASCDEFFFGKSFPMPKENQTGLIKLCQTQLHTNYAGPAIYATLFSTKDRIPVYSADVISLYPNCSGNKRPEGKYWNRVSIALCDLDEKDWPTYPISSSVGSSSKASDKDLCGRYQATNKDYDGNHNLINIDRGHLNPNSINSQDQEGQIGTFTLTNAAPQFSKFNEIAWREYECMTKFVILTFTPTERVYVITGTLGIAIDPNNNPLWMNGGAGDSKNPVKVPGYYWKAVCYPGNPWTKTEPWAYVVQHINTNDGSDSSPKYFLSLQQFTATNFQEELFADNCNNATTMGPIVKYFDDWITHVNINCQKLKR